MPPIFVDVDNNPKDKLFNASKAGQAATKAEAKIQSVVKKIIDKSAGFTTTKTSPVKGYRIRLNVATLDVANHETKCKIKGELLRYPSNKGGDAMLSLGDWSGSATASGTGEGSILDCVEAITESMVTKSVPVMRSDISRW